MTQIQADIEAPDDSGIQDHYVAVDGVRMHDQRAGSGPALVLLHGLVGSAKNWSQNIESFAREATVYALDLPNMGRSERVANMEAGLEATADRVAAWMDAVGLDDADIAAHSHGGAIALMLAARHPDRVRKLVLFAPANPFCDSGRHLIRFYRTRLGLWFARQVPSLPRALHGLALARMYGDARRVRAGALEGYMEHFNLASVAHVMRIVQGWGQDMKALCKALHTIAAKPALLIWGDRDRAVSLESSVPLRAYLPKSSMVVLPGVGHLAFEETPDICNRAVREWLRSGKIEAESEIGRSARTTVWDRSALRA